MVLHGGQQSPVGGHWGSVGVSGAQRGSLELSGSKSKSVEVSGGQCAMYIYPKLCTLLPVIHACLSSSNGGLIQYSVLRCCTNFIKT